MSWLFYTSAFAALLAVLTWALLSGSAAADRAAIEMHELERTSVNAVDRDADVVAMPLRCAGCERRVPDSLGGHGWSRLRGEPVCPRCYGNVPTVWATTVGLVAVMWWDPEITFDHRRRIDGWLARQGSILRRPRPGATPEIFEVGTAATAPLLEAGCWITVDDAALVTVRPPGWLPDHLDVSLSHRPGGAA